MTIAEANDTGRKKDYFDNMIIFGVDRASEETCCRTGRCWRPGPSVEVEEIGNAGEEYFGSGGGAGRRQCDGKRYFPLGKR